METFVAHLAANWQYYGVAFWVTEKIVKLTPWKQDDIIFDMVFKQLLIPATKKLIGK